MRDTKCNSSINILRRIYKCLNKNNGALKIPFNFKSINCHLRPSNFKNVDLRYYKKITKNQLILPGNSLKSNAPTPTVYSPRYRKEWKCLISHHCRFSKFSILNRFTFIFIKTTPFLASKLQIENQTNL